MISPTNQVSFELTNVTTQQTLIPAEAGLQFPAPITVDIVYLVFANTSSTATLVTVNDGTNDYYYEVPGNSTVKAVGNGERLIGSNPDTAWTVQLGTGVSSLFVTCQPDYRQ